MEFFGCEGFVRGLVTDRDLDLTAIRVPGDFDVPDAVRDGVCSERMMR